LEDSKGKQQQSVRPRWSELGNRWVEKKSTVFILELWCRTAPDTTCVQGNGPASRELSPIPTVPTSDRNKSSFDPWKRFRAAATNAAA